jgi:hypothetical protein
MLNDKLTITSKAHRAAQVIVDEIRDIYQPEIHYCHRRRSRLGQINLVLRTCHETQKTKPQMQNY